MSKSRLESFSDCVFSIVMTLLIFNVHVPVVPASVTDQALWQALALIWPFILIYVLTFAVLSVFWINHHFLFETLAKSIDRQINLLNLLYLMFVVFVPFTASLWGAYSSHQPAAILYGLNIFVIVFISRWMNAYIRARPALLNDDVSQRLIKQGQFRGGLTLVSYAIGIGFTFVRPELAAFFYVFPIIFNVIPGSLNLAEKLFGFRLD